MWRNFRAMPTLLKFITGHAIACVGFLLMSVIPGGSFEINGRAVSYSEWWSSGAGSFSSALGIFMPIIGVLLLQKSRYARPAYLFVVLPALVVPFPLTGQAELALVGLAIVVLLALYLYVRQPVQWYFASNQAFNPTGHKKPWPAA